MEWNREDPVKYPSPGHSRVNVVYIASIPLGRSFHLNHLLWVSPEQGKWRPAELRHDPE